MKSGYPFRTKDYSPMGECSLECYRFAICLDAYCESDGKQDPLDIIAGTCFMGPTYVAIQKAIKRKALYEYLNASLFDEDEVLDLVPLIHITRISEIFKTSYLPFWKEKDEEDWKYSLLDVDIKDIDLKKFQDKAYDIIDETYESVDPRLIKMHVASSSSATEEGKRLPHWKNVNNKAYGFAKKLVGHRSRVPKEPGGYRDCQTVSPDVLNTVRLIDTEFMALLEKKKGHIHLRNERKISRRIEKFFQNNTVFYMRDIKKEGLTKPRQLCRAAIEALVKKKPTTPLKGFEGFYDDWTLFVDKKEYHPKRGHGLGFANAITTFIQIVITEIVKDEMDLNIKVDYLMLNDDYILGVSEGDESIDTLADLDFTIAESLQIHYNKKKSFISRRGGVIAENYWPKRLDDKESFDRASILKSLTCANITHAKSYITAFLTSDNVAYWEEYKGEITSKFGFEFYPSESEYPSIFGGWDPYRINNVSFALKAVETLDFSSSVERAYYACREKKIKKRIRKSKKTLISPALKQIAFSIEDKASYFTKSINTFENDYNRWKVKDLLFAWERLHKVRNKIFKKHLKAFKKTKKGRVKLNVSPGISLISLSKRIVLDYPKETFYPASWMIKSYTEGFFIKGKIRDYYASTSPIGSYLNTERYFNDELAEDFSIEFINRDGLTKNPFLFWKQIQKRLYFPQEVAEIDFFRVQFPAKRDDSLNLQDSYLCPISLCCFFGYLCEGVPILKEEYRSPLIQKKRAVFDGFFPHTFLNRCTTVGISSRREIIRCWENNLLTEDWHVDLFWRAVTPDLEEVYSEDEEEIRMDSPTVLRCVYDEVGYLPGCIYDINAALESLEMHGEDYLNRERVFRYANGVPYPLGKSLYNADGDELNVTIPLSTEEALVHYWERTRLMDEFTPFVTSRLIAFYSVEDTMYMSDTQSDVDLAVDWGSDADY
jgi:hypothetical protein